MTDPAETREPPTTTGRGRGRLRELAPGLAVAAVGLVVAQLAAAGLEALSPIAVAVLLGIVLANSGWLPRTTDAGLAFAAKRLLRVGVVLLGFRLALGDVLAVGGGTLAVVLVVVLLTLGFTYGLGRRLGLSPHLALLTGTGYAICGASAVAAMREVVDADDDDAAFAIALVTMFGTAAILVLPVLAAMLDLSATAFGQWAGASVHDVGQVVATAASGGPDALAVAVVVKLTRVLLLGPLIVTVGLLWRRRARTAGAGAAGGGPAGGGSAPPLLPLFVLGFLTTAALRTAGVVPDAALEVLRTAESLFFTAALVGLGAGVRLARLRGVGTRGLVLGLVAWVVVACVAYVGVVLVQELGGSMSNSNGA